MVYKEDLICLSVQKCNTPIKRHQKSKQYDTVLQCIFAKLFNLRLANDIDRYSIKNERRQTVMSWEPRNNFLVGEYERAQTKSAKKMPQRTVDRQ